MVGWEFSVTAPMAVDSLGFYTDFSSYELAGPTAGEVGVWDATSTLLTSCQVGGADLVVDGFKYHAAALVVLLPGHNYFIGALYSDAVVWDWYNHVFAPEISFVGRCSRWNAADLSSPPDPTGMGGFGPSFTYTIVPEPSGCKIWSLLALAGYWARRRSCCLRLPQEIGHRDSVSESSNMMRLSRPVRWKAVWWLAAGLLGGWGMPESAFGEDAGKGKATPKPSKALPIAGEVFSVEGHTAFLMLPSQMAVGRGTPWVWYAPTLGGLPGAEEKWMFRKFLDAGMAVGGIDVGESYGNPAGRALFTAFYQELVRQRGLSKTPCLLARSRGGLMHYNWAVENPACVACVAGIYPVCDLRSYPGAKTAAKAYGMTEAQLEAHLAEHNPVDRIEALAQARVPIYHLHGDSDRVVPLERNSGLLAQRYHQLGGVMTLNEIKGQGHNMWPGWFECQELVDFVIAHGCKGGSNRVDAAKPETALPAALAGQRGWRQPAD